MEKAILSAALSAKARLIQNNISVNDGNEHFEARPLGWDEKGFVGMLQRAFTLKYFLFNTNGVMLSQIKYDDIHDIFLIEKHGYSIEINPKKFKFGRHEYKIKTSMTHLEIIDITGGRKKVTGTAKFGLTSFSIEFHSYPAELADIIKEIAALEVIKKMVWSMINPI